MKINKILARPSKSQKKKQTRHKLPLPQMRMVTLREYYELFYTNKLGN